jgi:zinc/manganese transport system substrate-binding protein
MLPPGARAIAVTLAVTLLAALALGAGAKIVVSFPAYDAALREAFPNADVMLLAGGVADPHEYQLSLADLELLRGLSERDVIVLSMHAPFEFKIAEMATRGEIRARVINMREIGEYLTWDGRLVRGADMAQRGAAGVNLHEHGLYPPNVIRLVTAVADATGLAPDAEFVSRLRELNSSRCCKLGGRAVALTPAAQYVLHWLGYRDIVVLLREHGEVSPRDLELALEYIKGGAPALAVLVAGEVPLAVSQFIRKAEEAGLKPRVVVVTVNSSVRYSDALREIAARLEGAGIAAPASAGDLFTLMWASAIAAAASMAAVVALALAAGLRALRHAQSRRAA